MCQSSDLSSFSAEEENLDKDRQGHKQGRDSCAAQSLAIVWEWMSGWKRLGGQCKVQWEGRHVPPPLEHKWQSSTHIWRVTPSWDDATPDPSPSSQFWANAFSTPVLRTCSWNTNPSFPLCFLACLFYPYVHWQMDGLQMQLRIRTRGEGAGIWGVGEDSCATLSSKVVCLGIWRDGRFVYLLYYYYFYSSMLLHGGLGSRRQGVGHLRIISYEFPSEVGFFSENDFPCLESVHT